MLTGIVIGQTFPQVPQFLESMVGLTHALPQREEPEEQIGIVTGFAAAVWTTVINAIDIVVVWTTGVP